MEVAHERGAVDLDRVQGVFEVEDGSVVMAQAAPLLRGVLGSPRQMISFDSRSEEVEVAGVTITPAEAYFHFRLLEEAGVVTFREQPGGGGGIILLDVKATTRGREWLIANYSERSAGHY